jgi:hypothetical protein
MGAGVVPAPGVVQERRTIGEGIVIRVVVIVLSLFPEIDIPDLELRIDIVHLIDLALAHLHKLSRERDLPSLPIHHRVEKSL